MAKLDSTFWFLLSFDGRCVCVDAHTVHACLGGVLHVLMFIIKFKEWPAINRQCISSARLRSLGLCLELKSQRLAADLRWALEL